MSEPTQDNLTFQLQPRLQIPTLSSEEVNSAFPTTTTMADPLSISASVAGLLSLTLSVSNACFQYLSSVRNSSASVASFYQEIGSLKSVLVRLDELTHTLSTSSQYLTSLNSLSLLDGIAECRQGLEQIHEKLDRRFGRNALSRGFHCLMWPFAKQETLDIVKRLYRFKSIFYLSMSINILYASTSAPNIVMNFG